MPAEPYIYAEWKQCKAGLDDHVEVATWRAPCLDAPSLAAQLARIAWSVLARGRAFAAREDGSGSEPIRLILYTHANGNRGRKSEPAMT